VLNINVLLNMIEDQVARLQGRKFPRSHWTPDFSLIPALDLAFANAGTTFKTSWPCVISMDRTFRREPVDQLRFLFGLYDNSVSSIAGDPQLAVSGLFTAGLCRECQCQSWAGACRWRRWRSLFRQSDIRCGANRLVRRPGQDPATRRRLRDRWRPARSESVFSLYSGKPVTITTGRANHSQSHSSLLRLRTHLPRLL